MKTKIQTNQTGIFNRKLLAGAKFSKQEIMVLPEEIEQILSNLPGDKQGQLRTFMEGNRAKALEFPIITPIDIIPEKIITFSEAINPKRNDFDCWVCFYENDSKFEILRNDPFRHIPRLLKFKGIISPDFTLQMASARSTQILNTYCGRVIASYLQRQGLPVIANVRYAGNVSRDFCCEGIPANSIIAVGALGCLSRNRHLELYEIFFEGLDFIVETLTPKVLIVYGSSSRRKFRKYTNMGIDVRLYQAATRQAKDQYRRKSQVINEIQKEGELL